MSRLSKLIDNVVVDDEGNIVGVIDEIIVRCHSGQISNIVVKRIDQSRTSIAWTDLSVTNHGFVLKHQASPEES